MSLVGSFDSTDIDRVGRVAPGPLMVRMEDDVDVLVTEFEERCDGIRDRRGTRGDLRDVSTRTSLGLVG